MSLDFDQWMARVDAILVAECGVTSDELEDWDWWDAWNDGSSPKVAAKDGLDYMGFYDFMDSMS